eukprot:gene15012-21080_t
METLETAATYLHAATVMGFDVEESLKTAAIYLHAATVVGLDVEWKPRGREPRKWGKQTLASLLQVATTDRVFLFDLIALRKEPGALDACLLPVFGSQAVLKLGFEILGDLSTLAASYPAVKAFKRVNSVLDLKELWIAYQSQQDTQAGALQRIRKRTVGLSTLAATLLGKPLDKSMQVSNWELRPLTERQVIYAAQDAHVLVRLYKRFKEVLPSASHIIQGGAFTFDAKGAKYSKKKPRAASSSDDESDGDGGGGSSGSGSSAPRHAGSFNQGSQGSAFSRSRPAAITKQSGTAGSFNQGSQASAFSGSRPAAIFKQSGSSGRFTQERPGSASCAWIAGATAAPVASVTMPPAVFLLATAWCSSSLPQSQPSSWRIHPGGAAVSQEASPGTLPGGASQEASASHRFPSACVPRDPVPCAQQESNSIPKAFVTAVAISLLRAMKGAAVTAVTAVTAGTAGTAAPSPAASALATCMSLIHAAVGAAAAAVQPPVHSALGAAAAAVQPPVQGMRAVSVQQSRVLSPESSTQASFCCEKLAQARYDVVALVLEDCHFKCTQPARMQ